MQRGRRCCAICDICNGRFETRAAEIQRGRGRHCSASCANKARAINRPAPNRYRRSPEFKRSDPYSVAQRKAGHLVEQALLSGRLERQPCEACGKGRTDAHHDDYRLPLNVRWLCRNHHLEHHRAHGQAPF